MEEISHQFTAGKLGMSRVLCKRTKIMRGSFISVKGRKFYPCYDVYGTYYALSGFGPAMRPYLWWKKYLTNLKLAKLLVCRMRLTGRRLPTADLKDFANLIIVISLCCYFDRSYQQLQSTLMSPSKIFLTCSNYMGTAY